MREIKFRAWHKPWKRWIDNGVLKTWEVAMLNDPGCHVMQYTGLKDKNGKEIYEGDIVKGIKAYGAGFSRKPGHDAIFEVSGFLSGWGWHFSLKERSKRRNNYRASPNFEDVEVIGNIYENGDLLK